MIRKMKIAGIVAGSAVTFYYLKDSKSSIYRLSMPLLHTLLSPEESHNLAISMIKHGLSPSDESIFPALKTKLWDFELDNPIGLAAGFDKNAEAVNGNFDFGFGIVEVGSITPLPQTGNPLPRFFRLLK